MIAIERVKKIILTPRTEWEIIRNEEASLGSILSSYVIPLSLFPAIAGLIGYGFIGKSIPLVGSYHSLNWGFSVALSVLLGAIICTSLASVLIDSITPFFGSEKNLDKTARLVAYSYTPVWVAGILNVIPAFEFVGIIAGFYGLYIMYVGLEPMKNTLDDKKIPFVIVNAVVIVVLYLIIGAILEVILGLFGLGMKAGYTDMPSL